MRDTPARLKIHVRSRRGASDVALAWSGAAEARVAGVAAHPSQDGDRSELAIAGVPPDGIDVELDVAADAHPELVVTDATAGLPASAKPLLDARGASAVPSQDGDRTLVSRRVQL